MRTPKLARTLLGLYFALGGACTAPTEYPFAAPAFKRSDDAAFLGVALLDQPSGGPLVRVVYPGLLRNASHTSPLMESGDVVVPINGRPTTKTLVEGQIRRSKPGDQIVLLVQRADAVGVLRTSEGGSA